MTLKCGNWRILSSGKYFQLWTNTITWEYIGVMLLRDWQLHSPSVMTWTLATAVLPGPGLHSYLSALSFMMVPTSRLVTNVPLLSGSSSIPEFSPPMNLAIWILFVFGIWYRDCFILPCHPFSILNSQVWYQLCTLCMSALTWTRYSHRYQVLHLLLS